MKIAINGFGRIGKSFLRTIFNDKKAKDLLDVVAINLGPGKIEHAAHLFKYDTIMGTYPGSVSLEGDTLIIDGKKIKLYTELDALKLPWKELGVDWVVDCSGAYTKREKALDHVKAGAKKVLISAPCKNDDITIVPGVNDNKYDPKKDVMVSLASCTTNALASMVKVLMNDLGFQKGFMTTIHSYTNSQVLLDVDAKDPRRARAAALNIIPTTTGAARAAEKVIPELEGKLEAMAVRVPVPNVSLIDLVFKSNQELSVDIINKAYEKASKSGQLKGIVSVTHDPVVSSDLMKSPYSVVIDASITQVLGSMGKLFGWYDNEWGYSERLKDFLMKVR